MKKLILIIFTIISYNAVAQTQLIGIKGGVSQTNTFKTNDYGNTISKTGFTLGVNY